MSPLREAAKKASAIASPRSFRTWKRGRASRTWARARAASWRQAAGLRPIVVATSSKPTPKTSCSRKAARSSGDSRSSASISGRVTSSSSLLLDHRLGQPRADVGLAPAPRRFELVEAEPGHRAAQERLGLAHRAAVGPHPADEGLLHHVLGIGDRAEHPVGDADQPRTQRIEHRRRVPLPGLAAMPGHAGHAADFLAGRSTQPPKPTASRFQPLMMLITSVSFTCSSSEKCAFRPS